MTQSREVIKGTVKVNKTKLYNLVKAKSPFALPKMKYTKYRHSGNLHWLSYTDINNYGYIKCTLCRCLGSYYLTVCIYDYDNPNNEHDEFIDLSFDDLVTFGLVVK